MMSSYLVVKLIHIVSATVLFGTGLGTAFFMFTAHRSGNLEAIKVTSRYVVIADWVFTLPAVIVQLATGLWLTDYLGIPWSSVWFTTVMTLFVVVGLCWLPVVRIQISIKRMVALDVGAMATRAYRNLFRLWVALGIPAFALTLVLFALMVLKPGLAAGSP
jgi:uncharacterized membrane protein